MKYISNKRFVTTYNFYNNCKLFFNEGERKGE